MRYRPLPSITRLQELFQPDFASGYLVRRIKRGAEKVGAIAGAKNDRGYVILSIDRHLFYAHRVLYALFQLADPGDLEVDHINGDKSDNRIINLRLATRAQNGQNIPGYREGLKGAYLSFKGENKPWMSTINKDGVRHYLGSFYTEEEAHEAYIKGSATHHGEFGRTG